MQAEIITIGDEILIGQVVDTNSAWIAGELNKIGVDVNRISSISDDAEEITDALDKSLGRVSLVLMTGGLGPTNDDITKKTLTDYFGMTLVQDDLLYERIEKSLGRWGISMNRFNREQALIPDSARIILNDFGSAPCLWFEHEGKVVISMPGIPFEMKGLMQDKVLDAIKEHFATPFILHKTVMVYGIGESVLAEILSGWEENLPQNMKLAYLPSQGIVRLRLSAPGQNRQELENEADDQIEKLSKIIPENIFGFDGRPMELAVADLLQKNKLSVGTAESCTGGYISHLITSHPGSSDYFKGGIVAYSNEIKINLLGVGADDLEEHGAVSREIIEQMAIGAQKALNVDYAIATSGIAGPEGGTEEKPVGTIWIAVAGKDQVQSKKLNLYKFRDRNIRGTALHALNMLRLML